MVADCLLLGSFSSLCQLYLRDCVFKTEGVAPCPAGLYEVRFFDLKRVGLPKIEDLIPCCQRQRDLLFQWLDVGPPWRSPSQRLLGSGLLSGSCAEDAEKKPGLDHRHGTWLAACGLACCKWGAAARNQKVRFQKF